MLSRVSRARVTLTPPAEGCHRRRARCQYGVQRAARALGRHPAANVHAPPAPEEASKLPLASATSTTTLLPASTPPMMSLMRSPLQRTVLGPFRSVCLGL